MKNDAIRHSFHRYIHMPRKIVAILELSNSNRLSLWMRVHWDWQSRINVLNELDRYPTLNHPTVLRLLQHIAQLPARLRNGYSSNTNRIEMNGQTRAMKHLIPYVDRCQLSFWLDIFRHYTEYPRRSELSPNQMSTLLTILGTLRETSNRYQDQFARLSQQLTSVSNRSPVLPSQYQYYRNMLAGSWKDRMEVLKLLQNAVHTGFVIDILFGIAEIPPRSMMGEGFADTVQFNGQLKALQMLAPDVSRLDPDKLDIILQRFIGYRGHKTLELGEAQKKEIAALLESLATYSHNPAHFTELRRQFLEE